MYNKINCKYFNVIFNIHKKIDLHKLDNLTNNLNNEN